MPYGARAVIPAVVLASLLIGCDTASSRHGGDSELKRLMPKEASGLKAEAVFDWPGTRTDPEAFKEVFSQPELTIVDIGQAGPRVAVAEVQGCNQDFDECRHALVFTGDNWAHEAGVVLSAGYFKPIWVHPLPTGSIAVAIADPGEGGQAVDPFIMSLDGSFRPLQILTKPGPPRPGSRLVDEPPGVPRRVTATAAVWVLDAHTSTVRPLRQQPCGDCEKTYVESVEQKRDGTVYAFLKNYRAERVSQWMSLRRSDDGGSSWRNHNYMPVNFGPHTAGFPDFAYGRGTRLAVAWTGDWAAGENRIRIFISPNGSSWRRLERGHMPRRIGGLAVVDRGRLVICAADELWIVRPGSSTPRRHTADAPIQYALQSSGGMAVGVAGRRSIAVSRDGVHWRRIEIGESLLTSAP